MDRPPLAVGPADGQKAEFNADDSAWQKADWWIGSPFLTGWNRDNLSFSGGLLNLRLDDKCPADRTSCCYPSVAVCNEKKQYAGSEYRTLATYSFGKFETSMRAVQGHARVTGFFTYDDSQGKQEIDIEVLGKYTGGMWINYWSPNDHGCFLRLNQRQIPGFDATHMHKYAFVEPFADRLVRR